MIDLSHLQIELRPVYRLLPYARNSRTHSTDAGDVAFDPFMGSGTTMAAAHVLGRAGYGCEISPAYCDVIVRRMINLGLGAMLESNGDSFADVAAQRGADPDQALNPKAQDSGAIKHKGPNPFYGRKAS